MAAITGPRTTVVRVGADIGQRQDYTAIAVTEEQHRGSRREHYVTRRIQRLPLGTPYPAVVEHIVATVTALRDRSRSLEIVGASYPVECWIDATGVGLPIVDLVREAGIPAKAVLLTGSDTVTMHRDDLISLGKGYMVSRLQVLLQAARLHLPISEEAAALIGELQDYHGEQNPATGHVRYNAKSAHDDLVIALALSVGEGRPRGAVTIGSWLPGSDEDAWDGRRRGWDG